MSRRRAVLLALLGLGIAGLVLLSSALPGLVFRYQDGQEQGQTAFAEDESLTLTLNQASGVYLQDKLTILREMSFTSISLQEKMMTHSSQEAVELCSAGLSWFYNNFGFDLSEIEAMAKAIEADASKHNKGTPLNDGYDGNVDPKSIKLSNMG